jgi:predicted restriction endonuclease
MGGSAKGKSWTHEELLIVCNLYFTLPFGQMHARNPMVISLARALGRTPGSVAMKLVNFASLDPVHQARGVSGLRGVSRADREIWEEFRNNWGTTAYKSEKSLRTVLSPERPASREEEKALSILQAADRPTDITATVRIRVMQSFFRRAVLSAYKSRCCVTGNPIPGLLVASHILPWSGFPHERVNPKNGLCLVAHIDKAFDQGLITFGKDMRLMLSSKLRAYLPNDAIESQFISVEGTPLRIPERFPPDVTFLEYHREKVFRG